jgi:hypothetical protein
LEQSAEIEEILNGLFQSPSRPLWGYSRLTGEPGQPFEVRLRASALPVAEELHRRFGDAVQLTVGRLSFPDPYSRPFRLPSRARVPIPDKLADFHCELDGSLSIAAGQTVRHAVLLTASTNRPMTVHTNGGLTADVVDPSNGRIVGGFVGSQSMPLVEFPLRYQRPVRIPLLVGTASYEPALGYTVPPGQWALTVDIRLSDRRALITPPLPFVVRA